MDGFLLYPSCEKNFANLGEYITSFVNNQACLVSFSMRASTVSVNVLLWFIIDYPFSTLRIFLDFTHQGATLWSNWELEMSCKLRHLGFDSILWVPLDYLVHGSGGWVHVARGLLLRSEFKELCLVEVSHHKKTKQNKRNLYYKS